MHEPSTSTAFEHAEFTAALLPLPTQEASLPPPRLENISCPAALLDADGIVRESNEAWRASPRHAPAVGLGYLDTIRRLLPDEACALPPIAQTLTHPAERPGLVRDQTLACHDNDSEHWVSVSISTLTFEGRRAWLVLHQETTLLHQMERRHQLIRRLAAVQAMPLDLAARVRRLAVTVGDVLRASMVVLWERTPAGVLRARPLETSTLAPQVTSIAHTRQLLGVMAGRAAQWLRLVDGTSCFAVPLRAHDQALLLHFPRGPRLDAETLRLVASALQTDPSLQDDQRPRSSRSPREVRRQLRRDADAASPCLAQNERQHIERTLILCGYNVVRTARALGIARSTLYERFKDYGLTVPARADTD